MKTGLVLILAAVNVVLLAVLVLGTGAPAAHAQGQGFLQTDYVVLPCQIRDGEDAIFVLDLARERLSAVRTDVTRRKFVTYRYRSLASDFAPETALAR